MLVAEDDRQLREMIAGVLRADGYQVSEAADGLALLEEMVPADVALVVTDIEMPGLSGLDVLAILRCAARHTPVILITAFGDRDVQAEARDLGAALVLDKPFDLDALRAAVRDLAPPA